MCVDQLNAHKNMCVKNFRFKGKFLNYLYRIDFTRIRPDVQFYGGTKEKNYLTDIKARWGPRLYRIIY